MYARITKYKMRTGTRDEAMTIMDSVKSQIMALNGLQHLYNCGNEDGSGYIISIVESKDHADAYGESVKEIWTNFGDLLEAAPTVEGFDVLADWSN